MGKTDKAEKTDKSIEQATMIPFPPFDYRVYVYFVNDLLGAVKIVNDKEKLGMEKRRMEEIADGGGFHIYHRTRARSYVFLLVNSDSNQITHESYHVISNIFRWIEAQHEEELFAYHLGYLVQMIVQDQKKMLTKRQKRLDKEVGIGYHVPSVDLPGCN